MLYSMLNLCEMSLDFQLSRGDIAHVSSARYEGGIAASAHAHLLSVAVVSLGLRAPEGIIAGSAHSSDASALTGLILTLPRDLLMFVFVCNLWPSSAGAWIKLVVSLLTVAVLTVVVLGVIVGVVVVVVFCVVVGVDIGVVVFVVFCVVFGVGIGVVIVCGVVVCDVSVVVFEVVAGDVVENAVAAFSVCLVVFVGGGGDVVSVGVVFVGVC